MTFEIDVSGRTRAVSVERLPGTAHRFRVTVDGRVHLVDAVRVNDGALSLVWANGTDSAGITAGAAPAGAAGVHAGLEGGAAHHVAVREDTAAAAPGGLTLSFAEGVVQALVNGRRARRGAVASGPAGAQRIVAPMPGKVLRVLVQPGAEVAARQPLVVVEAMKMENELSSPKAGRVKDVAAVEGQSVEAGRLLVVVE